MRKRWIGYLLALFILLWAKLPGPSAQEEPDPSREFRCRHIDTEKGVAIEVSTEVRRIPWLSKQTTGIMIQKGKYQQDKWNATEAPLRSRVTVKMSRGIAKLYDLKPEVGELLTNGIGHYAIVTGIVDKKKFVPKERIVVDGKGQGMWRKIL